MIYLDTVLRMLFEYWRLIIMLVIIGILTYILIIEPLRLRKNKINSKKTT